MPEWDHRSTYQGLVCQAVDYRRSPGLEPEYGQVVIHHRDLKAGIDVALRAVDWRPVGGVEWPSPASIEVVLKSRATVTNPPPEEVKADGKLRRFGDLVMTSFLDGAGISEPMVYRDIRISEEGFRELNDRLAGAREHRYGPVIVHITDIRELYKDFGTYIGRINCRLPNGSWDPATIKGGKTPYSMVEVLTAMFFMLPGSPRIDSRSGLFKLNLDPPQDVIGEGELVKGILAQLLERAGLVPLMQPDNNYLVNPASMKCPYGKIPVSPGHFHDVKHVKNEKKNVWLRRRASAVLVMGRRRIRRMTQPYVPAIQSAASGAIYWMNEETCKILGTTLDEVKREVFAGHEKNFRGVQPKFTKLGFNQAIAFRKWAYRGYVPRVAFATPTSTVLEEDLERLPFLPMKDAPWAKSALAQLGFAKTAVSGSSTGRDKWRLFRPVVYAARYGQYFFQDFAEVVEFFTRKKERHAELIKFIEGQQADVEQQIRENVDIVQRARLNLPSFYKPEQAALFGITRKDFVELDADVKIAMAAFGSDTPDAAILARNMTVESWTAARRISHLMKIVENYKETIKEENAKLRKWELKFKEFEENFKTFEGVQAWTNIPHGPLEHGEYSLDLRTGILMFNDPACHVEQPFLLQREGAVISTHAAVMVTFGYEVNDNTPDDFTSVLFVAKGHSHNASLVAGEGPIPEVKVCALNRGSAIKPKVEKDPNLRLYEDEFGRAFNTTEVVTAAASRAAGQLGQSKEVVGYEYWLSGFQKCVLDAGVSTIQHTMSRRKAETYVSANAPGGRGPLGPGRLVGPTPLFDPRTGEAIKIKVEEA